MTDIRPSRSTSSKTRSSGLLPGGDLPFNPFIFDPVSNKVYLLRYEKLMAKLLSVNSRTAGDEI